MGNMDVLFQVMGQLQAALAPLADEEDVKETLSQLPQVVVVGGQASSLPTLQTPGLHTHVVTAERSLQSAGKSSLLEAIANMPGFLPKGEGIQTRRPLLLRLQTDLSKAFTVATFQNPHPTTNILPNAPIYDAGVMHIAFLLDSKLLIVHEVTVP